MAKGGVAQYHLRLCVAPTSGYAGCPTPNTHLPPAVPQSLSSLSLSSLTLLSTTHIFHTSQTRSASSSARANLKALRRKSSRGVPKKETTVATQRENATSRTVNTLSQ